MQNRQERILLRGRNLFIILLAALVIFILMASGCSRGQEEQLPGGKGAEQQGQGSTEGGSDGDEDEAEYEVVTLYFADSQAEKLIGEEREVRQSDLPGAVVEELINGSETGLGKTVPDGTRLLSLQVEDGVAIADFSREFAENHWGGSAGEIMTVYSIVNSLGRLDGIDKVQFMLEGEIKEELLGHMYYGEPIEPNWNIVE